MKQPLTNRIALCLPLLLLSLTAGCDVWSVTSFRNNSRESVELSLFYRDGAQGGDTAAIDMGQGQIAYLEMWPSPIGLVPRCHSEPLALDTFLGSARFGADVHARWLESEVCAEALPGAGNRSVVHIRLAPKQSIGMGRLLGIVPSSAYDSLQLHYLGNTYLASSEDIFNRTRRRNYAHFELTPRRIAKGAR